LRIGKENPLLKLNKKKKQNNPGGCLDFLTNIKLSVIRKYIMGIGINQNG